jgi:hypothetical protein
VRSGRLPLIVLASLCLFGCSRRPGLNFDCKWVPDPAFAVDLRNEAHVQHLLDDIRVAEELDIRYGDRLAGYRLVETFGIVSRHGRDGALKNRNVEREAQHKCLATLFHTMASTHGVTMSDLEGMRPQLAGRGFDLPITLPVLLLLVFALTRFIRWMRNRFEADEWLAWLVASLVGSLFIPTIVLGIGWLWAMLVEIVRVGNEHVGYRERTESLLANFLVMFGIAIVATWIGSATSAIRKRSDSRFESSP